MHRCPGNTLHRPAGPSGSLPCPRARSLGVRASSTKQQQPRGQGEGQLGPNFSDPEAKFKRYGRHFGGVFRLNVDNWLDSVPRVRVRQAAQRQKDELLELVALNERLTGTLEPWEVRKRLEHLRVRRRNWEAIYNYVIRQDAAATLALVEEAAAKVGRLGGGRQR